MASTYVDFAAVKRATSIERVADWLGLKMKRHGAQLRCACPVTGGGERALVITPAEDVFYCFAPRCQAGGDLLELVAHVQQVSTREAALALQQHLWPSEQLKALDYLVPDADEVQALGIAPHVAKALGIGYAPRGTMAGRVCFPLRSETGKLAGYLGVGADGLKLPKRFFL